MCESPRVGGYVPVDVSGTRPGTFTRAAGILRNRDMAPSQADF